MYGEASSDDERDRRLQAFAAELTSAAYTAALRHVPARAWLDLELDLWKTLIQVVRTWDESNGKRGSRFDAERRGSFTSFRTPDADY